MGRDEGTTPAELSSSLPLAPERLDEEARPSATAGTGWVGPA